MAAYVGKRFRVCTIGGDSFEGILHSVDANNKKLSLMKVCIVPSGKRLTGLLHFYGQEIEDVVEVIDEKENKTEQSQDGSKNDTNDIDSDDDDILSKASSDGYIYIRRIGSKFRKAVDHIKTQPLIGVGAESEQVGRRAKISLLQVCCTNRVFIFDVLSLGSAVLIEGLADILESNSVIKVMHDSRWLSDQLFHQYSVKLTNVYDTQVADVLVRMRRMNGQLPHKLCSLSECLVGYLDKSVTEVYPQWLHDQAREMESDPIWLERPVRPKLLSTAANKVRHLPDLRVMTLHHLLAEFTASVDVFLGCIRDMPDMTRSKANVSPSVVPRQLERLVYGHLPSTSNPPISNHSSTPIGYDPSHKGPTPQSEPTANALPPKPAPSEAQNATTVGQSSSTAGEAFALPKMTVHKTTVGGSSASAPTQSNADGPRTESTHRWKVPTVSKPSTIYFSPSSDGKTVERIGHQDPDRGGSTEKLPLEAKKDQAEGFWDLPNGGHFRASGENVQSSHKAEDPEQDVRKDSGRASGKLETKSETVYADEKGDSVDEDEDSSDDDDSDDDDDDSDDSDEDSWVDGERHGNGVGDRQHKDKPAVPSASTQPKLENLLLRLSPGHKRSSPPQNQGETSKTRGRRVADSYLTSQATAPSAGSAKREHTTSRMYSSVLRDAVPSQNQPAKGLNVDSPAQFPELDGDVQRKLGKRHSDRSSEAAGTDAGASREGQGSVQFRPMGASAYSSHPEESTYPPQSTALVNGQQGPQRSTSPAVGRGRARTLAYHEDILRNIRRPTAAEKINLRDQKFDFPSREEMEKIPKRMPQLASSCYSGPKVPSPTE